MEFSDEYLSEQKSCVSENSDYMWHGKYDTPTKLRLQTLKDFVISHSSSERFFCTKTLSVGCSGHEPIFLKTSHALDICPLSNDYLKIHGYQGEFVVGSCDNLPFSNDEFDCAVCSEVIEHLPNSMMVSDTFLELDRVAKSWIVTTPNVDKCNRENQYKGHLQFWNEEDLKKIIPLLLLPKLKIYTKSIWIIVEKNEP